MIQILIQHIKSYPNLCSVFKSEQFENRVTSGKNRYLTGSEAPNPLIMHIFVISRSKSVFLDTLFLFLSILNFGGHFEKKRIFTPPFWIEVDDVECWNSIPNLVFSTATYLQSFKKIEAKLRPWQCARFFDNMAAMTSSIQPNRSKLTNYKVRT